MSLPSLAYEKFFMKILGVFYDSRIKWTKINMKGFRDKAL